MARRASSGTWLALVLIALAAFGVGILLRGIGPIGTDISGSTNLAGLQRDRSSPSTGPSDARITMVVFTDYRCPACRAAHAGMLAAVREAGDVRIVFRDYPIFGPMSERAARVALAARNQGLYEEVHDAFMREQRPLSDQVMRGIVVNAGGDWERIEHDLWSDRAIGRQLASNREAALRVGVAGTPTYLIGPYRVSGALSQSEFAEAFAQVE